MARPVLQRLAAAVALLGLLSGCQAFLPSSPTQSQRRQPQPQQRRPPPPHSTSLAASPGAGDDRPPRLVPWVKLQRALAPLALSVLPLLAPRPLTPPAFAAAAAAVEQQQQEQQQRTMTLLADGIDVDAIKQATDTEALAGFGKGQGEQGERLMGLVQPVMQLTKDQEGMFKVGGRHAPNSDE